MSEFKVKSQHYYKKKDKFKDTKRIKRIIFLKLREVAQIQTTLNLCLYPHFQIYPSGYNYQSLIGVILTITAMIYVDNQNKKRWQKDFIYKQKLENVLEFTTLYLEESNKLLACFKNIKNFIISQKNSKQTFLGYPIPQKGINYFKDLIDNNINNLRETCPNDKQRLAKVRKYLETLCD